MRNAAITRTINVASPNGGYGARVCVIPWFALNIERMPQPEIIMYVLMFFS